MRCILFATTVILLCSLPTGAGDAPATQPAAAPSWAGYCQAADPTYELKVNSRRIIPTGRLLDFQMKSQTWKTAPWRHSVKISLRSDSIAPDLAVIYIGGVPHTSSRKEPVDMLSDAADGVHVTCASITKVPNACFGQDEQKLMTYAAAEYLATKDPEWVPLAPMCKAVIRAMDLVRDASTKELDKPINRFILVGHSKRGVTAWMTAVIDPRVVGIVPIGADVLNLPAQLNDSSGVFSAPGARHIFDAPAGQQLTRECDPYAYREHLAIPKMVVSGTNDDTSSIRAVNRYLFQLPGAKTSLMLPGTGHSEETSNGKTINNITAFVKSIARGEPFEPIRWSYETPSSAPPEIQVTLPQAAERAFLWSATSPSTNFARSQWTSTPLNIDIGPTGVRTVSAPAPEPDSGYAAYFIEVQSLYDGGAYYASTAVYTIAPKAR